MKPIEIPSPYLFSSQLGKYLDEVPSPIDNWLFMCSTTDPKASGKLSTFQFLQSWELINHIFYSYSIRKELEQLANNWVSY